ncbi:hypothetical protein E2C01_081993 [Portunus trituberculatus]|uniref:Uncharacterized protein n=1 Tax=Portunus trituberculatus TaxID=210409 RepID=A0A5B7ITB9_PORTR|nr:hypothetical protein [Portunus trituberculatus]
MFVSTLETGGVLCPKNWPSAGLLPTLRLRLPLTLLVQPAPRMTDCIRVVIHCCHLDYKFYLQPSCPSAHPRLLPPSRRSYKTVSRAKAAPHLLHSHARCRHAGPVHVTHGHARSLQHVISAHETPACT